MYCQGPKEKILMKIPINFSQGMKKYSINTVWVLAEKFIRIILGVVLMAWVIRYLGPKNFGSLQYARSIAELLSGFALAQIGRGLGRELIRYRELNNILLGSAFILKTVGYLFFCVVVGISIYFMDNTTEQNSLIWVFVLNFMMQNFSVIQGYFDSNVLSKYIVCSNLTALFFTYLFRIWLVLNQYPLVYFAWSFVVDSIIATSLYIYFYSKCEGSIFKWKFDFSIAKRLAIIGWPYIFSSIVIKLYGRIDQVMLKSLVGIESVGYYAAALRICEPCFVIPELIVSSLFPAIINSQKDNYKKYLNRIQKLYELVIIIFLIISLCIMFFSDNIISIMYGAEFASSGKILSFYIFCGLMLATNTVRGTWMLSQNLQRYSLILCVVGAIFNIKFNLLLIGQYGIMGVVYGTFLAHIATFLFTALVPALRPSFFMILKAYANVFLLKFLQKEYFKNI